MRDRALARRKPAAQTLAASDVAHIRRMPVSLRSDEPAAPELVSQSLQSGGQPLPAATRSFLEPRFGHDFSQVRVHSDAQAAEAAKAVDALAYTVGQDVVFARDQYAPGTSEGQRLIAHELAHVVQQERLDDVERPSRAMTISSPGDAAEREADAIAGQAVQGRQAAVAAAATTTMQRDVAPPETGPDTLPAVATEGQEVSPENMRDEELAGGIIDDQLAILKGWDTALENFNTVLTSASDKEAKPNFAKVVTEFLEDEVMGEILKHAGKGASEAFGLLKKLSAEVERAETAKRSATLRDFLVQHRTEIGKITQSTLHLRDPFVAKVRMTREAKDRVESSGAASPPSKKSRGKPKGHVEVASAATKEIDDYWTMHLDLLNAYAAIDARLQVATPEILFRKLSEEWIREAEVRGGMGIKFAAMVIIVLNPDYSIKSAHIQGAGGQKIAEELLRESPDGVDVFGLETRREIKLLAPNGWPSAILDLDENDRNINSGAYIEGDYEALQSYVLTNGLPPTKKLTGDS